MNKLLITVSNLSFSQLTAVGDNDGLLGLVGSVAGVGLNFVEDVHAGADLAEDDVGTVQMRGVREAQEELAAVGAWASVGHREDTATGVLVDEVLVSKVGSVDGFSASSVSGSEVAALSHEALDDSVEGASLVVEGLAASGLALLARAQSAEVLGRLGGVGHQVDNNTASGLTTDGDVIENLGVESSCHRLFLCFEK